LKATARQYPARLPLALALALAGGGCSEIAGSYGGAFRGAPAEMDAHIGARAKALVAEAFDFRTGGGELIIVDHHVHAVARGTHERSGRAYINPGLRAPWRPLSRLKTAVLMSASGVADYEQLDTQYERRLALLLHHFQDVQRRYAPAGRRVESRFYLYALDAFHDERGQPDSKRTDLYVPNDYVLALSARLNRELEGSGPQRNPRNRTRVVPVASVHPYRADFRREVARLARRGARHLKWLPSAMNIDLEKVSGETYDALARQGMTLLVHTGSEHTLRVSGAQRRRFDDPYRLRKALDHGATVVALHSGREGRDPDTGQSYFERFLALMKMPRYRGRLFGEISAMTLDANIALQGSQGLLLRVMEEARPGGPLHRRMVNGSDYPIPAVAYLNPTRGLAGRGMISAEEREALNEIYGYNPLLFDFVLKRALRHPETGERLPEDCYAPLSARLSAQSGAAARQAPAAAGRRQ